MAMKLWIWLDSVGLTVCLFGFMENIGSYKSDIVFVASMIFLVLRIKSYYIDIERKKVNLQSEKLSLDEKKFDVDKKIHPNKGRHHQDEEDDT